MNRLLIIFTIIFISFCHIHSQTERDYIASFSIEKDNIKFLLYINKTNVSSKDTLNLELEILNESDLSIFVVPTFHYSYIMDSILQIPNSIYLDFGGSLENDISGVPFVEIEKNKNFSIKKNFLCSNFSYDGFLYFDQSNIAFLEKDLSSMVKVIHKN
jgi:hypothetical protein